ncbi:uncharacterized protein BDR25DRAFT_195850, partial [Lindgomyces ingoldianus]
LLQPWDFIPKDVCAAVEARVGGSEAFWKANTIPIVISRNSDFKSSINKIKSYLGAYRNPLSTIPMPSTPILKSANLIIPVAAQGVATSKLVSIVEMAKRVVMPSQTRSGIVLEDEDTKQKVEEWYAYTSLGGRLVRSGKSQGGKRKRRGNRGVGEAETGTVDVDVDMGSNSDFKQTSFPVITIWLARSEIPEFRDAFGEQRFKVLGLGEQD